MCAFHKLAMFDLLQAVCDDLEKTRTDLNCINEKLEEVCESRESSKFKFFESQCQNLVRQEAALLDQRLQLWLLTKNSIKTREEDTDEAEENLVLPTGIAILIPVCILALICLHLFFSFTTQQSRLKFVQI